MANVVIVVDMLRGFLEPGYPLYCGDASRKIIPHIQQLLNKELEQGSRIIFLADNHDPDDLEFRMFPKHCVVGTVEAEVIPELVPFPGEIMPKKRYSGFYGTPLEQRLKELKPNKIIIVGVCTDICVLHTAADARNRDYLVEVPVAGVASFDERMHQFALEHMEKILGVKLVR